jgi:hypothetical protein
MPTLNNLKEGVLQMIDRLGGLLLGENYERVDWFIERFYRLKPLYRSVLLISLSVVFFLLIGLLVYLYLHSMTSLQKRLVTSFEANAQIARLEEGFSIVHKRNLLLQDHLKRFNNAFNVKSTLSELSKKARLRDFTLETPSPTVAPLSLPLLKDYKNNIFQVYLPKASLKAFIQFLMELEKLPNLLKVEALSIDQNYQNKLYFEVRLTLSFINEK